METICFRNGYNPPSRQPFITLVLRNIANGWKRGHLAASRSLYLPRVIKSSLGIVYKNSNQLPEYG